MSRLPLTSVHPPASFCAFGGANPGTSGAQSALATRLVAPFTIVLGLALAPLAGCASCDPQDLPHQGRSETPEAFVSVYRHTFQNECWSTAYDLLSPTTRGKYPYAAFWVKVPSYRVPLPGAPDDTEERDVPLRCVIRGLDYVEAYEDAPEPGQAIVVGSWGLFQVTVILVHEEVPEDADRDPDELPEPSELTGWRLGMQEMVETPGWIILAQVQEGGDAAPPPHDCDDHDE